MIKLIKYLLILVALSASIIFIITLNKAKCSFSSFYQVKKDINLGYALESCKFLYKSYIYKNTKKIIYDSPFELILRKEREKKYGIKYTVLKK